MTRHQTAILLTMALLTIPDINAQIFAVGGNTVSPVLLTLQGELTAAVSKRWTMSLTATARPVTSNRMFMLSTTARRYREEAYTGMFTCASAGYLNYSIQSRSGSALLAGAGIGYSFLLAERLDLTLEAGLSLMLSKDFRFIRTPEPFRPDYKDRHTTITLVPFPVAVSITYLF